MSSKNSVYEVEQLEDIRLIGERGALDQRTEVLVKWLDYPRTENTWEPIKHINKSSVEMFLTDLKMRLRNNKPKLKMIDDALAFIDYKNKQKIEAVERKRSNGRIIGLRDNKDDFSEHFGKKKDKQTSILDQFILTEDVVPLKGMYHFDKKNLKAHEKLELMTMGEAEASGAKMTERAKDTVQTDTAMRKRGRPPKNKPEIVPKLVLNSALPVVDSVAPGIVIKKKEYKYFYQGYNYDLSTGKTKIVRLKIDPTQDNLVVEQMQIDANSLSNVTEDLPGLAQYLFEVLHEQQAKHENNRKQLENIALMLAKKAPLAEDVFERIKNVPNFDFVFHPRN